MKLIKILGFLVVLVLAVVGGALFYLSQNLDGIVKEQVQVQGSKLTQTAVKLNDVNISLKEGRATLQGFSIANPGGYSSPAAFNFGKFNVQLDPGSVLDQVIVIKDLTIEGVKVTVEQKGKSLNLYDIKKAIDSFLPAGSDDKTTSEGPGKKFMIEKLTFETGELLLISDRYGEKSVKLPEISHTSLGDKENGVEATVLAKRVMQAITDSAKKAAEREIKDLATDEAKDKLKDKAKEKLKGLFN